ncbi:hypothetical protein HRbin23_00654 [bacterium HR23]|nr:hypothetical protein HRbin23_00654 [bacterium HR23]
MQELLALGFRTVPVTLVDTTPIVGFNPSAIARALGLASAVRFADDPRWMLQNYTLVLEAALRATRQVSNERLEWVSPERRRTLRQFLYHLFHRPCLSLKALATGEYAREQGAYEQEALAYATSEEIARYGEKVLEECGPSSGRRRPRTWPGPCTPTSPVGRRWGS